MWDIVRWDPYRDMRAMRADLERLFARVPGNGGGVASAPWAPASDVYETDDAIVITAELPGVKDEDVEISVQDGLLRISGERRLHEEVDEKRFHRLERSYGGFERTFRLPPGVKEGDIKAGVAYGVLRVSVPKPTAAEAKRVPITTARS
jgi:HSP20 family protein